MPLLSVIIPVYNEVKTIRQILDKIHSVDLDKEIIVVDDGSTDGTDKILRDTPYNNLKVVYHTDNRGKGKAIVTGLQNASGDLVIIQDADLEYEPEDYLKLVKALQEDGVDLVLGSRFFKGYKGLWLHKLGNRLLTWLLNALYKHNLNDCFTCYKLAARSTFQGFGLKSSGFEIEIEILSKAFKKRLHIREVPISYTPRSYHDGKKIRLHDGMCAIFHMLKYRFFMN